MTTWVDGTSTPRIASVRESRNRVPGVVYAADKGVTADGSTDDTAALQACINQVKVLVGSSDRGTVYLPQGYIRTSDTIILRNGVRLLGVSKRGTVIKALGGFPTNKEVVRLGDDLNTLGFGAEMFAFDTSLERLTVDCNSIANSTGVYSKSAQEGCGCFNVSVVNCQKYGYYFYGGVIGVGDGASTFGCRDIECVGTGSSVIAGFYAYNCGAQNFLEGATIIPFSTGHGVWIEHSQFRLADIHVEGCADGIHIVEGYGQIENIHGNPGVTNLVHITATTRDWQIQNLYSNGVTGYILQDDLANDVAGLNVTAPSVQFYVSDEIRIGGTSQRSGSVAPTTGAHIRGEIIWNYQPASAGFIGWTCVTSGSPGTWKTFGLIS